MREPGTSKRIDTLFSGRFGKRRLDKRQGKDQRAERTDPGRRKAADTSTLDRRRRDDPLTRKNKDRLKDYILNRLKLGKMISVCSGCGAAKYRGIFFDVDKTKKWWNTISSRVTEKGKMPTISHSICGTCARELYPDITKDWDVK
ncbi:MAG TPA: hypothetical protein VFF13_03065 [archaeon]|nr:hypothetical protein [archaeon]